MIELLFDVVRPDELREYIDDRYATLDDEIRSLDSSEFEGKLRTVEKKGRQEELWMLYRRFIGEQ